MEYQDFSPQIEKLTTALESQRKTMHSVIDLLDRISNAIDDGFKRVNDRLSVLEGKEGMQGVNSQLFEIKHELHKIQKAYPYYELFSNMQTINKGEA